MGKALANAHFDRSLTNWEASMYKFRIALFLAGAAATSAFAMTDPPAQNTVVTQHPSRNREGAVERRTTRGSAERQLVNNSPNPVSATRPVTVQDSHPEFRRGTRVETVDRPHVRVETVDRPHVRVGGGEHRDTVIPRTENPQIHRQVSPSPNIQRTRPPAISRTPRIGTEPPLRTERTRPQWNRDWRNNRHYDWSDWRRHNRSVFHVRPYRDPYGWAYRLFSIGWRLWPQYYASSYWIYDPSMYRLPPAPPGTRWIRYYNDALLVDMYTGEVIDLIPNFFW